MAIMKEKLKGNQNVKHYGWNKQKKNIMDETEL